MSHLLQRVRLKSNTRNIFDFVETWYLPKTRGCRQVSQILYTQQQNFSFTNNMHDETLNGLSPVPSTQAQKLGVTLTHTRGTHKHTNWV